MFFSRLIGNKRETIDITYGESVPSLKLIPTNHVLVTSGINRYVDLMIMIETLFMQ